MSILAAEPACSRTRVLVAEDDHDLRTSLAFLLEQHGYEVTAVASGAQLLEVLSSWILDEEQRPPADVIVTDVRMPGFNGLHILEGLRASGWGQPVIVISAFGDASMQERVAKLGASVFLSKPFDPGELERALNTLCGTDAQDGPVASPGRV